MRSHRHQRTTHQGRGLTTRVLALGAPLAIIVGGVLTYEGIHNSPKAEIHRLTVKDHQRAIKLAKAKPTTSSAGPTYTSVPWNPTLPNEVATISIPALNISAPILAEGPTNGALTIPPDVHNVGWDEQTPTPGESGVTLLAGHVNWVGQGEGALGEIGQLVPGDQVILNWGGHETTWQITTKPTLSPNTVAHPQLFTNQGPPTLALVTCGGPFTEVPGVGGSYADNVIVEASPVTA
ncbi:class F sortase [Ferrimicrobium sp.]|uniref:class F sortase n=1 Tax=Ferrimicrobium sp. TaxID=2926050 RepID=UPI002610493A|nr:class F sortase [Ferrimicrobium sp.]